MDIYEKTSYILSEQLTNQYSSSFSLSSKLFSTQIRKYIYAIYALVRIADEIVDTYQGSNQLQLLNNLESQTYLAIKNQYSENPIVHAFAVTSKKFNIDQTLIKPFFDSMRSDIAKTQNLKRISYDDYIYGSAEVVGLMCLKVFVEGDTKRYEKLKPGAQALGSAYQKVNFLRDFADDYRTLGRIYFPNVNFESFSEDNKAKIVSDIYGDFDKAKAAILQLPDSSKVAVATSYMYYRSLLGKLANTSIEAIKTKRVRLSDTSKLIILAKTFIKKGAL